ncbi:MAG: hypothetical protein ACOX3S_04060 [Anaerolineae bacterium]|jgi:hypothetical protein
MFELERRWLALLAALASENALLLDLLQRAPGRGLRWAERQMSVRRIVV